MEARMAATHKKYSYLLKQKEFVSEEVIPICADYYFDWLLCDAGSHLGTEFVKKTEMRSVRISFNI